MWVLAVFVLCVRFNIPPTSHTFRSTSEVCEKWSIDALTAWLRLGECASRKEARNSTPLLLAKLSMMLVVLPSLFTAIAVQVPSTSLQGRQKQTDLRTLAGKLFANLHRRGSLYIIDQQRSFFQSSSPYVYKFFTKAFHTIHTQQYNMSQHIRKHWIHQT